MLTILFIHLAGLASPGPDFFYVVRQSASHSIKAGILASIGIAVGIIFWAGFAIFGLALLSGSIGSIFQHTIMIIGGGYLTYIGLLMAKNKQNATFNHENREILRLNPITEIKKGLLINIFNAKAGIYFTSVVSAFIGHFTEMSDMFLLLFLFVFTTFLYFVIVSLLFSRQPIQHFYAQYSRYIDNIVGIIFIIFGLMLIYNGLSHFTISL